MTPVDSLLLLTSDVRHLFVHSPSPRYTLLRLLGIVSTTLLPDRSLDLSGPKVEAETTKTRHTGTRSVICRDPESKCGLLPLLLSWLTGSRHHFVLTSL